MSDCADYNIHGLYACDTCDCDDCPIGWPPTAKEIILECINCGWSVGKEDAEKEAKH